MVDRIEHRTVMDLLFGGSQDLRGYGIVGLKQPTATFNIPFEDHTTPLRSPSYNMGPSNNRHDHNSE